MSGPLPRRLLLALAVWPVRPVPATAAAAQDFTLEALMALMARVPGRRAAFIETRRFAALETTLQSRGHLAYRPGWLEKVTDWPQPERLEVDGDRVVLTEGNDPPRVIDIGMAPPLRVLIDAIRGPLSGDVAALRRAFVPTVTGWADGWALTLVPREAGVLRSVRLQGQGDAVSRIAVVQANGDEQVMAITPE